MREFSVEAISKISAMALAFIVSVAGFFALAPTPANAAQSAARCLKELKWDPAHHGYPILVPGNNSSQPNCLLEQGNNAPVGIKALQKALKYCYNADLGSSGIDGIFGTKTRQALIKVQHRYDLAEDGVYGNNTRDEMEFWSPKLSDCGSFSMSGD